MSSLETPLPIRLAQTLGITSSLVLAGQTLSTSFVTAPRLLESPASLLLRQWGNMYDVGKKTGPTISAIASSAFFYLAYKTHISNLALLNTTGNWTGRNWLYTLAGFLSVGIVPYTFAVMLPTNKELLRKVEVVRRVETSEEDEVERKDLERNAHQLVDSWATLNLGRGFMLLGSGVLGVWASLV
ncbi:uncharacterized protein RAG0_13178 [Rhynchosporium agropyri]|uniref:DUF1772-domain-containing protein n=1 Tax=Rhynchosporium agropyri TaxID=914238 RepID=A0A1E1LBR7_9HELO|nr:uncharacterized protein RAG0_13178 [Rhynchosporium agropyri]